MVFPNNFKLLDLFLFVKNAKKTRSLSLSPVRIKRRHLRTFFISEGLSLSTLLIRPGSADSLFIQLFRSLISAFKQRGVMGLRRLPAPPSRLTAGRHVNTISWSVSVCNMFLVELNIFTRLSSSDWQNSCYFIIVKCCSKFVIIFLRRCQSSFSLLFTSLWVFTKNK